MIASDALRPAISVNTSPGAATFDFVDAGLTPVMAWMFVRLFSASAEGTGYYKIPSLKGVWYRGHYTHDGSVGTLEEMFDPDRLKDTHIPR